LLLQGGQPLLQAFLFLACFGSHVLHHLELFALDNVEVVTARVASDGLISPKPRLHQEIAPRIALSRATFHPAAWLETARALVGVGGTVVLTGAEEFPAAIEDDPGSAPLGPVGSWRYRIPATGSPRVIAARRFTEVAKPSDSI